MRSDEAPSAGVSHELARGDGARSRGGIPAPQLNVLAWLSFVWTGVSASSGGSVRLHAASLIYTRRSISRPPAARGDCRGNVSVDARKTRMLRTRAHSGYIYEWRDAPAVRRRMGFHGAFCVGVVVIMLLPFQRGDDLGWLQSRLRPVEKALRSAIFGPGPEAQYSTLRSVDDLSETARHGIVRARRRSLSQSP